MEEAAHSNTLFLGFVMLGFALAFVLLFRRLGLGATLGYLVAGAVADLMCSAWSAGPRR